MSKDWTKIRAKVKDFIESEIYPKETELAKGTPEAREMLGSLMQLAKDEKNLGIGTPRRYWWRRDAFYGIRIRK